MTQYSLNREANIASVRKRQRRLKESGLCQKCGQLPLYSRFLCYNHCMSDKIQHHKYYLEHREIINARNKERYARMKLEGKCPGCGIATITEEGVYCVNCVWAAHNPKIY